MEKFLMEKMKWKAIFVWAILVLLVIVVVLGLMRGWGSAGWNRMGPGMMGNWGFGPFAWLGIIWMWLIPIGFIILVVAAVVWLMRGLSSEGTGRISPNSNAESSPSPREILQTRYARGEITRDQYLQMLDDLS
jgi:putative membrane protein